MEYTKTELAAIRRAKRIITNKWAIAEDRAELTSPAIARETIRLHLAPELEREVFAVAFLNSQHGLLAIENIFYGTLDGAAIYPREVVKAALRHNAAAVVLAHNHPSGTPTPSGADKRITQRLIDALALIDIRVLDHIIVAGYKYHSFAEAGEI